MRHRRPGITPQERESAIGHWIFLLWNNNFILFWRVFHLPWCNQKNGAESYVKEGLQRPPNVLPSGPFKKVS